MSRLEDLISGATVRSISTEGLATVLSVQWLGVSYAERATNPATKCCHPWACQGLLHV